jgi:hypothetical protein
VAENEDKELAKLYETSKLPREPNRQKLDKIRMEMVEMSMSLWP